MGSGGQVEAVRGRRGDTQIVLGDGEIGLGPLAADEPCRGDIRRGFCGSSGDNRRNQAIASRCARARQAALARSPHVQKRPLGLRSGRSAAS